MRCRCAHFQQTLKKATKSSRESASDRIDQAPKITKSATCTTLHQPSSILPPQLISTATAPLQTKTCTKSSSTSTLFNMIRRSQRETAAKNQSATKAASTSSATSNSFCATTAILPGQTKPPRMVTATLKSQHLQGDSLCVKLSKGVPPRPNQSELNKAGGGRHPHPPSANNSKLKHKCPFDGCPWRFATPYKLRRHIKSHTKETPYLCKECGRGFSVRYNLLMHIQTIHSQPQKFKCPIRGCKDAFHSQSRLNGHLRRIHKNNWKTLQGGKESSKTSSRRGSSISSTDSSDSILASNTTSRKTRMPNTPYKCPHCEEEFSSKAKLGAHVKCHTSREKAVFECIIQDCGKVFSSRDKFIHHEEMHNKSSKQFCCPHKNCNRIFLRQTHLRNHLKIHTQDHQFVCPVLDCSQKFSSESAYNVHLNTHINYGYSCPHASCDITFLSRQRLAIHTQAVHSVMANPQVTGSGTPLMEGIQPHLGGQLVGQDPSLLSLSEVSSPSSSSTSRTAPIRCVLDKDFLKHIDLPGLSADDIEAILSENEDWSGEQIDQFLRSAIDLSEIESKLFSLAGYESDSGYSAYDVSPVTSNAPANLTYSGPPMVGPGGPLPLHPHHCPPTSLGLLDHSNLSPLFSSPPFISLSLPPPPHSASSPGMSSASPTSSLMHDPMSSPCASDGGFFSPHSSFASLSNTPNHDSFFSSHSPVSMYPPPFSQPQDFTMPGRHNNANNILSINGPSCFSDIQNSDLHDIDLPIPGIFLHDLNPTSHLPCSVDPTASGITSSAVPFMDCAQDEPVFPEDVSVKVENLSAMVGGMPLDARDIMPVIKKEEGLCGGVRKPCCMEKMSSDFTNMSPSSTGFLAVVKTEPDADGKVPSKPSATSTSSSSRCDSENTPPQHACSAVGTSLATTESLSANVSRSKKTKSAVSKANGKNVSMKGKKKSQWPRSMNRANLLAFRQRILNKLKKGQEIATDPSPQATPLSIMTAENPSSKPPSLPVPPLIKCEASSLNSDFEVQVMYERNHMTTKRCHSKPAKPESVLLPLHTSQSEGHLNCSNSNMGDELSSPPCLFEEEKFFGMPPGDADDLLLSSYNFNPDVLLSSHLVEMMLDGLGFKFDVTEKDEERGKRSPNSSDTELDMLVSRAETGSFSSSPTSSSSPPSLSLGDRPSAMDIDCFHNLLTESGDCGSISPPCSSSSLGSPDLTPIPHTCKFDFGGSCSSTPTGGISRSVSLDGCSSPSYQQNRDRKMEIKRCFSCDTPCISDNCNSNAFRFPEILSVEGSMVLDGVSVISEGEGEYEAHHHLHHHMRDAFLHSTHDPLLASDRHSVALFDGI